VIGLVSILKRMMKPVPAIVDWLVCFAVAASPLAFSYMTRGAGSGATGFDGDPFPNQLNNWSDNYALLINYLSMLYMTPVIAVGYFLGMDFSSFMSSLTFYIVYLGYAGIVAGLMFHVVRWRSRL